MPRHLFFQKDLSLLAAAQLAAGDAPIEGDGTQQLGQVPEWVNVLPEPEVVEGKLVIYSRDGRVLHIDSMEKLAKRSNAALKKQKGGGLVDADHTAVMWGGKAIAWAEEFEARPGKGMWARTDWLTAGEQLVGTKQYRYTSSVVSGEVEAEVNEATWSVTWHIYPETVDGFAVTNIPALVTTSMFADRSSELEREAILAVLLKKLKVDDKNPTMAAVREAFSKLRQFTVDEAEATDSPPRNLEKPTTPPADDPPPPIKKDDVADTDEAPPTGSVAAPTAEPSGSADTANDTEVATLRKQIAELNKSAGVDYVSSLLTAGKITPAMKSAALEQASTPTGLAQLRALYAQAPSIVPTGASAATPATTTTTSGSEAPYGLDPLAYKLAQQGMSATEIARQLAQRDKENNRR